MTHLVETQFWRDMIQGIYGQRKGGARIIIDGQNASTGCGKTSLAVGLAVVLSRKFGYQLQPDDFTLSGAKYLSRWRDHPGAEQPSVLILDELSGAGAADSRRAMAGQNVDLGRTWQLMRKKRVVTITTLPHWGDADTRMQRFCDYRLNCREKPMGYFRAYRVGTTFDDGSIRTYGFDDVRRIRFPNMDEANSEFYQHVTRLKDDLLDSTTYDADDLETDDEEDEEEEDEGPTPNEIADAIIDEDRVEDYVTTNQHNGQEYVSKDLLRAEYGLTVRDAKQVKALLDRARNPA